jgi:hypothetical protein
MQQGKNKKATCRNSWPRLFMLMRLIVSYSFKIAFLSIGEGYKKIKGQNRNSAPFKIQYPMKNQDEGIG